jgi:hypothetical protein
LSIIGGFITVPLFLLLLAAQVRLSKRQGNGTILLKSGSQMIRYQNQM